MRVPGARGIEILASVAETRLAETREAIFPGCGGKVLTGNALTPFSRRSHNVRAGPKHKENPPGLVLREGDIGRHQPKFF